MVNYRRINSPRLTYPRGEGDETIADTIIAIDPGREKCGLAVVSLNGGVLHQAVIPVTEIGPLVEKLSLTYQTATVILGNGTAHRDIEQALTTVALGDKPLTLVLVDEKHSTEQARIRYWQLHPPKGLRRLLPVTMQLPPVPIDDYVAIILAERYLNGTG